MENENVNANENIVNNFRMGDDLPQEKPVKFGTHVPKHLRKSTIAVIVLAILVVAGFGFGAFAWLSKSAEIDDLKWQIAERNKIILELQGNGEIAETGNVGDISLDDFNHFKPEKEEFAIRNLLITSPEQLVGGDGKPVTLAIDSVWNGCRVALYKKLGALSDEVETGEMPSLNAYVQNDHLTTGSYMSSIITNIDTSKIIDVFVGGFEQNYDYDTAFFLMDDGTVEYMPFSKAVRENDFRSYGKLPGVRNVIKLMRGNFAGDYSLPNGVFAQRADGKFYRLYDIIEKTGNY